MKPLLCICLWLVLCGTALSVITTVNVVSDERVIREYFANYQDTNLGEAMSYCTQHYGHLADITTLEEYNKAVSLTPTMSHAWIGLKRTVSHGNVWHWGNGKTADFTQWYGIEPDDQGFGEDCVVMNMNGWYDTGCGAPSFSRLCARSFTLVRENKTWEEALLHCRTHYTDLAFAGSEGLLDAHWPLLKIDTQTVSVWTGLRFLDGQWSWVNRAPTESLGSLPQCPICPYRCGAYSFNTGAWENRDCNEERNFICYY